MASTVRSHGVATAVWVVAGSLAMYGMTMALATEMNQFPGGAQAFAESLRPGVEALRPMRWPADRLDTLGGYLSFHNITLYNLFLSVYAAVQGSRAVRGAEEGHSLEQILATGWSRGAVVRDQALGFVASLALISLGVGVATAAALAAGGQPDTGGSLLALAVSGLCAMTAYALGLFVSQLVPSARTAAAVSSIVLLVLYVGTNVWEDLGPLGAIRFLSPFHYANASRTVVPGEDLDLAASALLVAMAITLLWVGAWAFARRDYGQPLWPRRVTAEQAGGQPRVQRSMLRSVWRATLLRGRVGLVAWSLCAALFTGLMMALEPTVMDAWEAFKDYLGDAGAALAAPEVQYLAFAGDTIMPVVAAYTVAQAAGWVTDLAQGRVEMVLTCPVSWSRLVLERLAALVVGVGAITAGGIAAILVGAAGLGVDLDAAGLLRLAAGCLLLGLALGSVASLVVVLARTGPVMPVLTVFLAASYLVSLMGPIYRWPEWAQQLSVFAAVGHPYLDWPTAGRTTLLVVLAVPGALLAAALAERTPKVA